MHIRIFIIIIQMLLINIAFYPIYSKYLILSGYCISIMERIIMRTFSNTNVQQNLVNFESFKICEGNPM